MLILTRNIGQSIRIGDDINIIMLPSTNYNQVKVGIDAPAEISVHREEIYQRLLSEYDKKSINDVPPIGNRREQ